SKQRWGGLHGSAQSLAIAEAARKSKGLTLLITTDNQSAEALEQSLTFFAPDIPVLHFPDWETLPYDMFSPHQSIISQRISTLYHLPQLKHGILVVPIATLLHRVAPTSFLLNRSLVLETGQKLNIEDFRIQLESAGYHCVDTVYEHGEFAVRGALIDLYPMGSRLPFRIDLFDDEIETLRTFDPETQRSTDKIDSINLLPGREFPLDKQAISYFRARFREQFDVNFRQCPIYQDISAGIIPAGIEYYIPLFFEQTATLFDYFPTDVQVFLLPNIEQAAEVFWVDAKSRYKEQSVDPERPILSPVDIFLSIDECFSRVKDWTRIEIHQNELSTASGQLTFPAQPLPDLSIQAKAAEPLKNLQQFMTHYEGRILFCAESAGRREVLLEMLSRIKIAPKEVNDWPSFLKSSQSYCITVSPLEDGLHLDNITLINEHPLFGQRVMQKRQRNKKHINNDNLIKNLTELHEGAPVVHIDHGIGRYQGLITLDVDNQVAEFLTLAYADEAKLYVPVANLHLISRYTGSHDELAPLHRLGSETWQKAKRQAAEKVRDVAAELLDIYARRAARKGYAFVDTEEDYMAFSSGFPFEETPDQQVAIDAVRKDMLAPKPMDRLVCGDVGFGKTEVAMRAAFIAVNAGKQVAILVPTTLLAQQHYNSFRDRFADWPVKVSVVSRFNSGKDTQSALEHLSSGHVDIIIGTHKLLQDDIKFKDLGLIVIDEEHRFGVRQKEQLKSLRSEVDILTLTATPIPRTLNMAFAGMRDLSIIATPPARRLSVKTFVMQHKDNVIKEALLRELLRGGQVYYLHNDVKTIEQCAQKLSELVPEARIAVGHGQMRERDLEQVMGDFYHKRFNVLVASTIIETGIDVPNANTIIIDRADKFGLAQLHQLRGRVGRSHHQAYAYLLTPTRKNTTSDAQKRLEAVANTQDLGAGFTLATHDLEIRGAGELLGDGQSGQIQSVGFTLYMEMLERAVSSIQKGEQPNLDQPLSNGTEINLRIPALIPDDYLPDVHTRLILYKRIASTENNHMLKDIQVEMIDRFGLLPTPVKNLIRQTQIKLIASKLGIKRIDAGPQGGRIEFATDTCVDPITLIQLIQSKSNQYKLENATLLRFNASMNQAEERFSTLEALFANITPTV
ncbi:UNVERIFIED_CONTAM: hypothetical protein GTU68_005036, partial [Idotea baltica]|nr:hypothetical protein [Idotea baltica]